MKEREPIVAKKKVGIAGVGRIGSALAHRFLEQGDYEVVLYNRTKGKLDELVERGATRVDMPRELAEEGANPVLEVTAHDESAKAVCLGPDGILAGSKRGLLVVMSTLSDKGFNGLAHAADEEGWDIIDAPTTGGPQATKEGKIELLVGGDETVVEEARPVFDVVSSKNIIYLGPRGSGMRFKKILNATRATQAAGFRETKAMIRQASEDGKMDAEVARDTLIRLVGGQMAPRVLQEDTKQGTANFPKDLAIYGVRYAQELKKDASTPLLDKTVEMYETEIAEGRGSEEWTKV